MILLAAKSLGPYITLIGLLIVAVMGAGIALLIYRARVLKQDTGASQAGLLDDLRAMRDRGEITQEEFDAAKASIGARLAGRPKPGESGAPDKAPPAR